MKTTSGSSLKPFDFIVKSRNRTIRLTQFHYDLCRAIEAAEKVCEIEEYTLVAVISSPEDPRKLT